MKIRNGFVSNSSSSSFCILGVVINNDICDDLDSKRSELKATRVHTQYAIADYDDTKYVGIDVTSMKDDETPLKLKQELIDTLKKLGYEYKVEDVKFYEEGGYNG